MNILVYGAGVLGSLYAARLQDTGHAVTILARGARANEIRAHGLVLQEEATGRQTVTRVRVVEQLRTDEAYDLILVLVRKNQLAPILPLLAEHRRSPNVLFMVNNASGPADLEAVVGRERVLLGFPGAGGTREGHVVRYNIVSGLIQPTTIGELDGRITTRLQDIATVLAAAGFPVAVSRQMDAWLKTHVALVSPIANAIYAAGGDNYRLACTRDGLVLIVRAIREGYRVLRARGIPITPFKLHAFEWVPEPILVAILQRAMNTGWAELVMARHANSARDEMQQLADEFRTLVRATDVSTPALEALYAYLDPSLTPMITGSAQLPLNWRGVWIVLIGILSVLAILCGLNRWRRS